MQNSNQHIKIINCNDQKNARIKSNNKYSNNKKYKATK